MKGCEVGGHEGRKGVGVEKRVRCGGEEGRRRGGCKGGDEKGQQEKYII